MSDGPLEHLDVPLERDGFMRSLVRHLAGALEDVVGLDEASGYVSLVGQAMGSEIHALYRDALDADVLTPEQAAAVMVDLKRRIQGDFYIIEQDEDRIVLGNRACPFGEKVLGRPSMCMMTSNVFGHIAAESTGYSKVVLEETIATGAAGCRVVVHLRPGERADAADGREYYQTVPAESRDVHDGA
jgi:predicted ArsR family transcriptional regulator